MYCVCMLLNIMNEQNAKLSTELLTLAGAFTLNILQEPLLQKWIDKKTPNVWYILKDKLIYRTIWQQFAFSLIRQILPYLDNWNFLKLSGCSSFIFMELAYFLRNFPRWFFCKKLLRNLGVIFHKFPRFFPYDLCL